MPKNNSTLIKTSILFLLLILLSTIALAAPNSINIQGKLTSSSGSIQTGTFNFTFRIYDNYTSGTLLYETFVNMTTTDARGVYDIILNNVNLPFNKQYYLAVRVDGDSEMSPRVNLTSVPYSFNANESNSLNASKDSTVNGNINLTAAGNINAGGTITGNILQAASQLNVNGGFSNGGLTINSNGDIVTYGDILFSGNISVINVSYLSINGSALPSLNNTFDIGNGSLMWRNGYFGGNVGIGTGVVPSARLVVMGNLSVNNTDGTSRLWVDTSTGNVGIGTVSPAAVLNVVGSTPSGGTEASSVLNVTGGTGGVSGQIGFAGGRASITGGIGGGGNAGAAGGSITLTGGTGGAGSIGVGGAGGSVTIDSGAGGGGNPNGNYGNILLATTGGNVGIGTTNPNYLLQTASGTDGRSVNLSNVLYVNATNGSVSIGTTTASGPLDVSLAQNQGVYFGGSLASFVQVVNGIIDSSSTTFIFRGTNRGGTTGIPIAFGTGTYGTGAPLQLYIQTSTGLIGINTSTPSDTLTVNGTMNIRPLGTSALYVNPSGNVGIGTTSPDKLLTILGNELNSANFSSALHINATDNENNSITNVITLDHVLKNPVNSTGRIGVSILFRATDNASQIYNIGNISAILYNSSNGSQLGALTFSTSNSSTGDGAAGHLFERMRIDGNGWVGIGTTTPGSVLSVVGNFSTTTGALLATSSGRVGIGTTTPTSTLHVIGTGNFSGNLYAGSCTNQTSPLNQTCTDIAELFPVEKNVEAGDLVCLKENGNAGYCDKEFDNKILGVISTNPAIIIEGSSIVLGRGNYQGDKLPIALKGRVPVKVDCTIQIKQGDLLVSANKRGFAQSFRALKISNFEDVTNAWGIHLGKALEECKNGEKAIMAWVG